jgi:hypothetical protein
LGYFSQLIAVLLTMYATQVLPEQTDRARRHAEEVVNEARREMGDVDYTETYEPSAPVSQRSSVTSKVQAAVDPMSLRATEPIRQSISQGIQENETQVVALLNELVSAQADYYAKQGRYAGRIESLTPLNNKVVGGLFAGYKLMMTVSTIGFRVNASPLSPEMTGKHYYYVDQTGIIRSSLTGDAGSKDNPYSGS